MVFEDLDDLRQTNLQNLVVHIVKVLFALVTVHLVAISAEQVFPDF